MSVDPDSDHRKVWGAVERRRDLPGATGAGDQVNGVPNRRLGHVAAIEPKERDHPVRAVRIVGRVGHPDPLGAGHLDPDDPLGINTDAGAIWQGPCDLADLFGDLAGQDRDTDWRWHRLNPLETTTGMRDRDRGLEYYRTMLHEGATIVSEAARHWDVAMDVATYLSQMTRNRELFDRRIRSTEISGATPEAFSGEALRFLVLTEDFCGDSAQFVPPVIRLGQELDNVDVRLLSRDRNPELASGYVRKDGYQAIPVLIVLADDGSEIGYLVERPARVNDELSAETRRFARENPNLEGVTRTYDKMPPETRAAVRANADRYRDAQQTTWTRWLFEDLVTIVERRAIPAVAD